LRDALTLWSHVPLTWDADLCGVPDYLVTRRSPLGPMIFDPPYVFLVIEAKKDDFARAWGQCLAAMLAAQKLNPAADRTLFGATTNGRSWEFGRLRGRNSRKRFAHSRFLTWFLLPGQSRFVLNEGRAQAAVQPVSTIPA